MINNIQTCVGVPFFHSVFNGCKVCRGIQKSTVSFLNDHRCVMVIEKNADRALALFSKPFFSQITDDISELVVIKTLA